MTNFYLVLTTTRSFHLLYTEKSTIEVTTLLNVSSKYFQYIITKVKIVI